MDLPRTPMDNLLNVWSSFSAGHEKALKQGIYNALALFLLCIICTAGWGLYIILNPFVKPLIWALLCGSALFPFKFYLTNAVQSWFDANENSPQPLVINLVMIPVTIVDRLSENIGSFLQENLKTVGISLTALGGSFIIYSYTPGFLHCLMWRFFQLVTTSIGLFVAACNIYLVLAAIGYISVLYIYWTPENSTKFRYSSFGVWLLLSLYLSNVFGVYPVLIFSILQILFLIGFIYEVIVIMESEELLGNHASFGDAVQIALINANPMPVVSIDDSNADEKEDMFPEELDLKRDNSLDIKSTSKTSGEIPALKLAGKSMSLDTASRRARFGSKPSNAGTPNSRGTISERYFLRKLKAELRMSLDVPADDTGNSDKYMYGVLYCCTGMLLWKHKWILQILTLPIAYYVLKQIGRYFGFWATIIGKFEAIREILKNWCNERHQALVPAAARGLYKVYLIVDRKLTEALRGSVDAVATIAVIFGLLIFTFCSSVFITIQIYAEGMHLVQLTGGILNSTLVNNPDIDWLPEQWEESVNSVLDNAYTYGRTAIADGVKSLVKDFEPSKAEMLEKKVLELWDRLYQAWMMSDADPDMIGPTVDVAAAMSVWESFRESFAKMPTQWFNFTAIQNFAKENVGILLSVLDSIWNIVKGNMSVILSIITELLYVVLMSGSAVLNFALSTVVFFTTLFYLLNSSGKTYKPIEILTAFSPIGSYNSNDVGGFAVALQEAIIGVFTATFKLASFFGMWTWFIHNLFQVKIVYLPAAFASVLGAVPFLDAYFACIPATLELWFTRGPMIAVLFLLFHFIPYNIVVTDFYAEIKGGGHPYLTGLSIAGGILCLGVEGAIFGPLLLCCIMVAINLSRRYLHSPSAETLNSLKSQITKYETADKVFTST
ncbi:transmembrane protein 245 isoform X2 [Venturia canescens]|uniref:transmembrane protein 245 isoform X2 n=1 Tax=Venturia canescens TaxID=32260 RepID=UPI001C9BE99E|nr:transmembrane protein 245 isoform X2 [Venturia canescens]